MAKVARDSKGVLPTLGEAEKVGMKRGLEVDVEAGESLHASARDGEGGSFFQRPSRDALVAWTDINAATQRHLRNVYATMSLLLMVTGLTSAWALRTGYLLSVHPLVFALATVGLMGAVVFTAKDRVALRLTYTVALAACQGLLISPLLQAVIDIDPSIVTTALFATSAVFLCFSGAALLATRRSYLYLGSMLSSALSCLLVLGLLGMVLGETEAMFNFRLWAGLVVICLFVVYDTQVIIERHIHGDSDVLLHAILLLIDFIDIFIRILIILAKSRNK